MTRDATRAQIGQQLIKKMISTSGGGQSRRVHLVFPNLARILFEQIFLICDGKQYTETYTFNNNAVSYNVQARFIDQNDTKITTKCANGYCPPAMLDEIINYGKTMIVETTNMDKFIISKADVTYMVNSRNLIIDIDTASNSPHMINGLFASFV